MRRQRRGSSSGHEFGGSGEDSFVAVVVTKLTGALLFILLLTMVIMALIPKAVDHQAADSGSEAPKAPPVKLSTPVMLPEAIAGHPYHLALAASGGQVPLRWRLDGELPDGLQFDAEAGILQGTPAQGTAKPLELGLRVSDGVTSDSQVFQLLIYESDKPLTTPSSWLPGIPPIPWRSWAEHGYGFVVLGLVHLVGLNAVSSMQHDRTQHRGRFLVYKLIVWVASFSAMLGLALWISRSRLG